MRTRTFRVQKADDGAQTLKRKKVKKVKIMF
jgi:hypothetical protein